MQVGLHTLNDAGDECVQTRTVTRTINHASYNGETLEHDIALLKLSEPVDYVPIDTDGPTDTDWWGDTDR